MGCHIRHLYLLNLRPILEVLWFGVFKFGLVVDSELIWVFDQVKVKVVFLLADFQFFRTFVTKTLLSLRNYLCTFVRYQSTVCGGLFLDSMLSHQPHFTFIS